MQVKFHSFGSRDYQIIADTQTGTWYIHNIEDDTSTYRYVCSEGFEEYRRVKSIWRQSIQEFNQYCTQQTFYKD